MVHSLCQLADGRQSKGSAQVIFHISLSANKSFIISLSIFSFLFFLLSLFSLVTMSAQDQASSSLGMPPNRGSTDSFQVLDEENGNRQQFHRFPLASGHFRRGASQIEANCCPEIPDSSQVDLVDVPAETPNLRRNKDNPFNYEECGDSDSETQDATDEASAESEYNPPPTTVSGVTTRSRAKKETQDSERVTREPVGRSNATKRSHDDHQRSHDDHQSDTPRPTKRGRPTTVKTETKKFEKDALALVERFFSKAHGFETIRSENEDLKRQVKFLESARKQDQKTHLQKEAAQNEENTRLKNECKRLRIQLLSALDEAKKDSGKYVKVPDSDILQKWMQLSYNVRNTVSECLTEQPARHNDILKFLLLEQDRPLPQFDHEYMMLRAHILRRTIWHFLMIGIFGGEYAIWHGNSGRTLTKFLAVQSKCHS